MPDRLALDESGITTEMMDAAMDEILDYDPEYHTAEEIAFRILSAALSARRRSLHAGCEPPIPRQ